MPLSVEQARKVVTAGMARKLPNECPVLPDDELFDLSAGYDDEGAVELSAGLTEEKRQFAAKSWRRFITRLKCPTLSSLASPFLPKC